MSAATLPPETQLRETPLAECHRAHGGHMVAFAGWELPRYYTSILAEHEAVRSRAGLFDVSHMGIVTVGGGTAPALLSRRTTADFTKLAPGQCKYTFLLESEGKIVDDLIVTRLDEGGPEGPRFLAVPNAARATRIVETLRQHRKPDVRIATHNGQVAILAVQGPASREILEQRFGWSLGALGPYRARWFPAERGGLGPADGTLGPSFPEDLAQRIFVSRTGYTGELGFELFVAASRAVHVAESLVEAGVTPVGLGARDTLRMEKGYLLSGQDFDRDRSPFEAAQDRFVDLQHVFVGREALLQQKAKSEYARLVGIVVDDPGSIPRHGTPVLSGDGVVAVVTSGGLSPTLKHGIALAYLPPALAVPGTPLDLDLRGRGVPAKVTALPFLPSAGRTTQ